MNLHRIAREWYKPDIQSTPELTNWEASFDGGADWVPGTLVGGELMWLVQGPDFDPAENSDPGVTATTIVATTYPQVRAVDNPEVIVRTPPKIRLLGPVPVPRPEVLVTLPGIVTQMQGQVAAAEAAVAAAGTATDATVADKVTNGAATGAALNARYATVITAKPGETPAATRSRINGALASGFSRVYRFAGDFSVNGPIAVPSGVTIDAQDATFTLVAGAYSNLLVNAATLANTRTIYAAMTSGSAVLTAAGTDMSTPDVGPFAAGLVGKPVVVQGAGSAGAPLVTTVASYQSATQITLAANAATTVTGQYATVGARDSGITVIGGTWTRAAGNNNWGSQGHYLTHTMRFRHIDGLRIIRPTFNGSNGKYAVNAGDCTAVLVDAPYAPLHNSDLVHINGPAEKVIIRSAMSDSINDDAVSLTAGDSTGALDRVRDTAGDITNVSVETVKSKVVTGTSSALKIIAGKTMDGSADYKVTGIRGSNLSGPTKTAAVVFIGDATGGRYDDIDVHGITSLGIQDGSTAGTVVLVHGGSVGRIGVHGVTTGPGDKDVV